MKILTALMVLVLTACAVSQSSLQNQSRIERINTDELAHITVPEVSKLSLEDVTKMTADGLTADAIITKLNESNSSFDLTPSQAISLAKYGVDIKVLDSIHKIHGQILQNQYADAINQQLKAKLVAEKNLEREKSNRRNKENRWMNRNWGYYPFFGSSLYFNQRFGQYRQGFCNNNSFDW